MTGPEFGLRLPPCVPAEEVAEFAVEAEAAGFNRVWIPDSQFLWRDAWTVATLVAQRTSSVGIGIAVSNFSTRHVSVTASALLSLNEISQGRVCAAFGTGDSSVKTIGMRPTSLDGMRQGFASIRALLRGEAVDFIGQLNGGASRPMRIKHAPAATEIPLFMAASGPKALALAGEIADGVFLAAGTAPTLIQRALGFVREGSERGGRTLADIEICLAAHTAATESEEDAANLAKPLCVSMAQLGAGGALRAIGIDIEVPAIIDGIYPDVTHAETWEQAMAAADAYLDNDLARVFAENVTLIGTEDQIVKRIAAARAEGVDRFFLLDPSSYNLPHRQLRAFGGGLLDRLRAD